jgi:hypothetical protein
MKHLHHNEDEKNKKKEEWNENVETCEECEIHWKKINQQCVVCYGRNKNDIKFTKSEHHNDPIELQKDEL